MFHELSGGLISIVVVNICFVVFNPNCLVAIVFEFQVVPRGSCTSYLDLNMQSAYSPAHPALLTCQEITILNIAAGCSFAPYLLSVTRIFYQTAIRDLYSVIP